MTSTAAKALRTAQSHVPFAKGAKDAIYLWGRRLFSIPHEREFRALRRFPLPAGRVLVDVGANQGQSIESMSLYMPEAPIVSFEANPNLARKLQRRYRDSPRIRVHAKGLAACSGHRSLYVPAYKGFVYDGLASMDRSAAETWISEKTVFRFDSTKLTTTELDCEVSTLDAENLAPYLIKVDVQGCEFEVLEGGAETLRSYHPMLLLEDFCSDPRTVDLAYRLGYEEYNFDTGDLRKGPPRSSSNSLLLTDGMASALLA